jgi:hypothetical protein
MFGACAPPNGNVVRRHVSEANATQTFRPRLLIYSAIALANIADAAKSTRTAKRIAWFRPALNNSFQLDNCLSDLAPLGAAYTPVRGVD